MGSFTPAPAAARLFGCLEHPMSTQGYFCTGLKLLIIDFHGSASSERLLSACCKRAAAAERKRCRAPSRLTYTASITRHVASTACTRTSASGVHDQPLRGAPEATTGRATAACAQDRMRTADVHTALAVSQGGVAQTSPSPEVSSPCQNISASRSSIARSPTPSLSAPGRSSTWGTAVTCSLNGRRARVQRSGLTRSLRRGRVSL